MPGRTGKYHKYKVDLPLGATYGLGPGTVRRNLQRFQFAAQPESMIPAGKVYVGKLRRAQQLAPRASPDR